MEQVEAAVELHEDVLRMITSKMTAERWVTEGWQCCPVLGQ